jgi:hypothetical protein
LGVEKLLEDLKYEKNKGAVVNENENNGKKQKKIKDFINLDDICIDKSKKKESKKKDSESDKSDKNMDYEEINDNFIFQTNTSLFSD